MGLMKKLTAAIATSSLLVTMVGTAFAAYTPSNAQASCDRMMSLQILKGKYADNACALNDEITRAELATIVVRAFGQEDNAALLNGAAAFPDTANHWASGYVAIAKALIEKQGDTVGMPDGTFQPDKKLSPAEAVAFLMKFLGQKPDNTKAWPDNYLSRAVEIGLITKADSDTIAPMLNDNATRGLVFALYDNAYYSFDLGAGKTFYTKYVDTMAPVLTLDTLEATTLADKVTVTGKVEGATELYVGTDKVTVGENGSFSQDVALTELGEKTITVVAKDVAGNATTKTLTVTKTVGDVAKVEASDITVAAGATVDVAAAAKDSAGNTIADATITGESSVGTYADGKFTAGEKAGSGKLTLTANGKTVDVNVNVTAGPLAKVAASKTSAAPGEMVTLTAQDEFGNAITTGVTYTQSSANAMLDSANGKFMASAAGNYTITATAGEKTATINVGVFAGFDANAKVVVSAPQTLVGNGVTTARVTVAAEDANGNVITSFNTDNLTLTGLAAADIEKVSDATGNGVAAFDVVADWGLTGQVVTLTGTAVSGSTTVTGTTTFQVIPQVATSIKLSAPAYLAVNNPDGTINSTAGGTARLWVLDQEGESMLSGVYAVTVGATGPASFNNDGTSNTSKTFIYAPAPNNTGDDELGTAVPFYPTSLTATGAISFSASLTGLTSATASSTAAYAQAASVLDTTISTTASTYKAALGGGDVATVKVQLRDAAGVPVAKSGVSVTFKLGVTYSDYSLFDGSGAPITGNVVATTDSKGQATLSIKSQDFTGTLAVTTSATNYTSGTANIAYVAGNAAQVGLTRSTVKIAQGTDSVVLTAQVYDNAGNKALVAGKKIHFTANGTDTFVNGSEKADVYTDENGVASVKVTTIGYVRTAPYVVTLDAVNSDVTTVGVGSATASITIDNTVASSISVRTVVAGTPKFYVAQTDAVTIEATVKDAKGNAVNNDTVKVVLPAGTVDASGVANSSDTTITLTNAGNGVYTNTTPVMFVKAPVATFTVKDVSGVADLAVNGTVSVAVGAPAKLKVTSADSNNNINVTKGTVSGPFTISLTDNYGNPVYADAVTGAISIGWSYPVLNAANGEYFEIKSSSTGARLDGSSSVLSIPVGSNSVTFYVFSNVTGSVTFTPVGGTINAANAVTFTAQ